MKRAALAAALIFWSFPAYALSTSDMVTALLSVDPNRLREKQLLRQDLEPALMTISEYRELVALAQAVRDGKGPGAVELIAARNRCYGTLLQLDERTFFGRRKIAKEVMREINRLTQEVVDKNPRVKEEAGRQVSSRYRRALDQLLDQAVFSYAELTTQLFHGGTDSH